MSALLCASAGAEPTSIRIDIRDEKQVIHSFGASDAWSCQFVGEHWPLEKRNAIADLLFSMETDAKGNPKGIGLSMWRFNIGAGSAEQEAASRISSEWHRAECFRDKDGSYDWAKQKGQQWFLEAAKARGVRYLLAFTNSPPVHLTLNGIAHSDEGRWSLNIRDGALTDFAEFLVDVAEHFHKKGLTLDYISPINEPEWDWHTDKQEGTPATNAEVAELAGHISRRLQDKRVPSKVLVGEAANLGFLVSAKNKKTRGDLVHAYWSPSSPLYLGNQSAVARVISGHSYFTTWPLSTQIKTRRELRDRIVKTDPKLAFWQTEFCILEENDETGQGRGRDLGMDTALYVARVIHSDLTISHASHWSWWLGVSAADYKDGLVYIEKEPDQESTQGGKLLKHDGRVLSSKTLWALGNYSRFVRPGMVRIGLSYEDGRSDEDAAKSMMASAYLDKKTRQLVIVLINCTSKAMGIQLVGTRVHRGTLATYTTSETCELRKGATSGRRVSVPPRSVMTLVGTVE